MDIELRRVRKEYRLSIQQAAAAIGVSARTWWGWEKGERQPGPFDESVVQRIKDRVLVPAFLGGRWHFVLPEDVEALRTEGEEPELLPAQEEAPDWVQELQARLAHIEELLEGIRAVEKKNLRGTTLRETMPSYGDVGAPGARHDLTALRQLDSVANMSDAVAVEAIRGRDVKFAGFYLRPDQIRKLKDAAWRARAPNTSAYMRALIDRTVPDTEEDTR